MIIRWIYRRKISREISLNEKRVRTGRPAPASSLDGIQNVSCLNPWQGEHVQAPKTKICRQTLTRRPSRSRQPRSCGGRFRARCTPVWLMLGQKAFEFVTSVGANGRNHQRVIGCIGYIPQMEIDHTTTCDCLRLRGTLRDS